MFFISSNYFSKNVFQKTQLFTTLRTTLGNQRHRATLHNLANILHNHATLRLHIQPTLDLGHLRKPCAKTQPLCIHKNLTQSRKPCPISNHPTNTNALSRNQHAIDANNELRN
jgi:hypothetical protein